MKTKIITGNSNRHILWVKVWAIAAMQGAITLTWVIYNLYLPILLVQLGLAKEIAVTLLIIEKALEAVIEPIFGAVSDRQQKIIGTKVPLISTGVILSSGLFIAIPVLIIFSNDDNLSKSLFIVLVIVWASVMAIFRSPAMSLLGRCANTEVLPQAASILTLAGGIIGAFRFDVYGLIVKIGAGFAFTIGSVTLLGAATFLRLVHLPEPTIPQERESAKISIPRLSLIFITGMTVSWGLRLLIPTVSKVLTMELGEAHTKLAMTLFFVLLGLAALPAGQLASKLGNSLGMIIGGLGTVVFLLALLFLPNGLIKIIAIALLVFVLSLILNGAVPFALSLVPQSHGGLGVGMYFGGFGGGISLFDFLGTQLGSFTLETSVILSSIVFLSAVLCMVMSQKIGRSV